MESRKEITDFVTTKKTEKSGIYLLVKKLIATLSESDSPFTPIEVFCDYLLRNQAEEEGMFLTHMGKGKYQIAELKPNGEKLTINFDAGHGDICPKLRGILDLINADKEFAHFAVIVNNRVYIDDVLTGREYADRLSSRAAQLVLRVAILSQKCPLEDAPEEVDEEKDEA